MNTQLLIELFGYLGSALVVISMLMTSVMKLRIINTTGSVIFAIYALIIRSYPTALMNFCLVIINIWHMVKLYNTSKTYELVETDPQDDYLRYLIKHYWKDILKFFPYVRKALPAADRAFLICCDSVPAGIFLARQGKEESEVLLDYTTPTYRDCSVGAYLYEELGKKGIRSLACSTDRKEHIDYLLKMGFKKEADGKYRKTL